MQFNEIFLCVFKHINRSTKKAYYFYLECHTAAASFLVTQTEAEKEAQRYSCLFMCIYVKCLQHPDENNSSATNGSTSDPLSRRGPGRMPLGFPLM